MSNNSEYLKALINGGAGENLPTPNGTIGKYLKALAENSAENLPEPNSVIGEYLKALVNSDNSSELPKPNSTIAKYLEYLVKGGDVNQLPKPNSIIGEYLYQMCGGVVPTRPVVPNGTWQLKTTSGKKYIVLGTDDDNMGNAKYFRMLRSYGFPYTMNVEAERINADLGNDIDTAVFTDSDAPSVFPDGVTVKELGKYLHNHKLGEVAQHGSSANVLWDSERLTGDFLDGVYATYSGQGGTKNKDELRTAIMEQLASTDGSQDASYVESSREILEAALGFYIETVGSWGGVPTANIDGIELELNAIKGTPNYDWKAHNYFAVASVIGGGIGKVTNGTTVYNLYRNTTNINECINEINNTGVGKCVELFWHYPFGDVGADGLRRLFDHITELKNNGKVEVVTRKQYISLGEYVNNPIKSVSVSRNGSLNVGDTDTDAAYTITVTYADGTTSQPKSDVILDRSLVNTSESGTYAVNVYYRGFTASCNVLVMGAGYTLPTALKDTDYWFIYSNDTNGNWYCGNYSKDIAEAIKTSNKLLQFTAAESGGKVNGWKSTDKGVTWEQVTTNRTIWNTTISTNRTSDTDGGYQFGSKYEDKITWIETSGNFELNY